MNVVPKTSKEIAKEGLMKFAEITRQRTTPALAKIWGEALQDVPAAILTKAIDSLVQTWELGFLPTPGNVRKRVEAILSRERYSNNCSLVHEWEKEKKVG